MTDLPPIEPRLVIKNRTPLLNEQISDYSYIATLIKTDKSFVLTLAITHNFGLMSPVIRNSVVSVENEKLVNDSMLEITKNLPSKEIDILAFDNKLISDKEFGDTVKEWIKETAIQT